MEHPYNKETTAKYHDAITSKLEIQKTAPIVLKNTQLNRQGIVQVLWSQYGGNCIRNFDVNQANSFVEYYHKFYSPSTEPRSSLLESNPIYTKACYLVVRSLTTKELSIRLQFGCEAELLLDSLDHLWPSPLSLSARAQEALHLLQPKNYPCVSSNNNRKKQKNCECKTIDVPEVLDFTKWGRSCASLGRSVAGFGWISRCHLPLPTVRTDPDFIDDSIFKDINSWRIGHAVALSLFYRQAVMPKIVRHECLWRSYHCGVALRVLSIFPETKLTKQILEELHIDDTLREFQGGYGELVVASPKDRKALSFEGLRIEYLMSVD